MDVLAGFEGRQRVGGVAGNAGVGYDGANGRIAEHLVPGKQGDAPSRVFAAELGVGPGDAGEAEERVLAHGL